MSKAKRRPQPATIAIVLECEDGPTQRAICVLGAYQPEAELPPAAPGRRRKVIQMVIGQAAHVQAFTIHS